MIALLDSVGGASGNMMLGALLDAGLDVSALRQALAGLPLSDWSLRCDKVVRRGISATHVEVEIAAQHDERHLADIERIVGQSRLPDPVKERSLQIFRRLAEAEARVHGVSVADVHFHEVGAVDAIVDIVGTVVGLGLLGVEQMHCGPLPVGRGVIECAHGTFPNPAPATAELLRDAPLRFTDLSQELVTPTGAAIISTLATFSPPSQALAIKAIGYGAGTRDLAVPNVLRLMLAETAAGNEELVVQIDTNVDDMNPQVYDYLMQRLFAAGALDVFMTPVMMKKNRPGCVVTVLSPSGQEQALTDILLAETTTLGVRRHAVQRSCLDRQVQTVGTSLGEVRVKVATRDGQVVRAQPEYDDCRRLADTHGLPLLEVMARLQGEVAKFFGKG